MAMLEALAPGILLGLALSVYPGSAYARLRRNAGASALRTTLAAVWPLLLLDLSGILACRLVLVAWRPSGSLGALLTAPLLVYLLWRGWHLVETPASRLFVTSEVPSRVPGARELLLRPLRRPRRLLLRVAVSFPAALLLSARDDGVLAGFLGGWALGYAGAHLFLLLRGRGVRPGEPYVVRPDLGRVALGLAGLTFFGGAFFIVIATGMQALEA